MSRQTSRQHLLLDAVRTAARAPSIHNSQPWRFHVDNGRVDLYADRSRRLQVTDADGRDLLLSCGAALHHLRLALSEHGYPTVHRFPTADDPGHLASVELRTRGVSTDSSPALLAAVTRRQSDRRPFTQWPVPQAFVRQLVDRAADQGAVLRLVRDPGAVKTLLAVSAAAGAAQENTPGYQAEMAQWTGADGSVGIPAGNVLLDPDVEVLAGRRFPPGDLVTREAEGTDGADLMVLGTASDDPLSQLRAGEALSAVLLQAAAHGLATCPITQVLENRATRQAVQDNVLGGTLCPQVVVRVGWAPANSPVPQTPRRALADLLL